jgi:HEAT repeat protein
VFFVLFFSTSVFSQTGKPSADDTEKNIKILQSLANTAKPTDAQLYSASMAILSLTQTGTDAAAPELGRLLSVVELNTAARTALVNIGDVGITELRGALDKLEGKNLAGVIESLASVRDEKSVAKLIKLTKSNDAAVAKSAVLALGKIASPNALRELKSILSSRNSKLRLDSSIALLSAAEQLNVTKNAKTAIEIYRTLRRYKEFSAVWSAATQSYVLSEPAPKDGLTILGNLILSKDKVEFRTARDIAVKMQSPQAGNLILKQLPKLAGDKKIYLIEILGIRGERDAVPILIEFAKSSNISERVAAIKALGLIGDMSAVDVIFDAISSTDNAVSSVGKTSLSKLDGAEFKATIIKNLDSKNKVFRLTALKVVEERRITESLDKVKSLFGDADVDVKVAAYRAYSQAIVAAPSDLELLLNLFQKSDAATENEKKGLQEALLTVCRKIPARDESVAVIEKFKNAGDTNSKRFLMDLLYFVGNVKACGVLAELAKSDENEIVDHATMLLGKWSSADVAPFLIDLAANHPLEKYRVRTLSGYLRVIRQFGLSFEQKYEMIQKAESIATRDADKKRIAEIKEKIQAQLKAKPIFDGKTFEGWEGNLSLFRIEDGAIVAGMLNKRIPRNEFLCTKKEYSDFTLYLEIKVLGKGANAGVQFRSRRLTDDKKRANEVMGYQADMTETEKFWGCLYDEARRGKFLAEAKIEDVRSVFRPNGWNELKIVCKGDNIKLYVNDKMTVDYTEKDEKIPKTGIIGLQIHGGDPCEAWYRNIRIEE